MEKKKSFNIIYFVSTALFFLVVPLFTHAAGLELSPSFGSYLVGDEVFVDVVVSSPSQSIVASSGSITFKKDIVEVLSISKNNSIFSFYVQEPSFSNASGVINFEGIVFNPGYIGSFGRVLSIKFKIKKAGFASINFSSGSILANDGNGTEILNNFKNADWVLSDQILQSLQNQEMYYSVSPGTPLAPKITSPTHPDSLMWYSNANPTFQWILPKDVTDVSFAFNQQSKMIPDKSRGLVVSHGYENVEDGIWYFHIRFKNSRGWGLISDFKIQIDTKPPEPMSIKFPHGNVTLDNRPLVLFNTQDKLSGIDFYEVKIGDQDYHKLLPGDIVESNPYVIPPQDQGEYVIKVIAYDKAGNTFSSTETFQIIGLNLPEITDIPKEINEGDILIIEGRTYPRATVVVLLESISASFFNSKIEKEERIFTNSLGQFVLTWPNYLKSGQYEITAYVIDENGARSANINPYNLIVKTSYLLNIGQFKLTYLIFFFIFLLVVTFVGGWILHIRKIKNDLIKKISDVKNYMYEMDAQVANDIHYEGKDKMHNHVGETIKKIDTIIKDIKEP